MYVTTVMPVHVEAVERLRCFTCNHQCYKRSMLVVWALDSYVYICHNLECRDKVPTCAKCGHLSKQQPCVLCQ